MSGKELLMRALRGEKTERPAWVPFVGVHGGHLIGKTAEQFLKSSDFLVEGLDKSIELYKPDGLPVYFDLQVEAELLGCDLHWADDAPPAVTSHPLTTKKLAELPEYKAEGGRFPVIAEALERLLAKHGEDVAFYGLICGPFTLALHLLGNDIFLEMYDDEDYIQEVMNYAADVAIKTALFYIEHGCSVVAVVDPMTSQISPDHFEEFVTPAVNKVYDAVREAGGMSSMFVCGDANRNLEVMVDTHADNVSVDEQIPMGKLRELTIAAKKSFGGNIKLTSVLLLGDTDDAKLETLSILDDAGDTGFVLAPGCDLPFDVPPENLQAVAEMVHDEYAREIARSIVAKEADSFDDITLPDYAQSDKVRIDVITLDSTACAPCQYMWEASKRAASDLGLAEHEIEVREHKIKERDGIGMMVKLGVKSLPTICIDGVPKFSSIIPDHNTIVEAMSKPAKEKGLK